MMSDAPGSMRAVRCTSFDGPEALRIETMVVPRPSPGEVLVKVAACGVSFPDLLMSQGRYHVRPELPFTLGGEFAGTVAALGEGVSAFAAGERVSGFALTGAFAEYMSVPAERVRAIVDGVSFETAAAFSLNYATAYAALRSWAKVQAGESVVVLGAGGGIGSAAVQLAKVMGARVIACASSEAKLAFCRRLGADETIDYADRGLRGALKEITGARGVDVVLDPVGGERSEAAFRSLGWRGRHVVVGFAAGSIPRLPLNLPLLKGASVMGFSISEFVKREPKAYEENWRELDLLLSAGTLAPHIEGIYSLGSVAAALSKIRSRDSFGKLVLSGSKQ